MKKIFLMLLVVNFLSHAEAALNGDAILQKADVIRNPQIDYTVTVRVASHKPKRDPAVSTFKCLIKGRDKSLVETLTPAVDRGRLLLMNGQNYWGYLPNVSKPLRISMQEKLTGEVANGDLSRVNFSGDYTVTATGQKSISGKKMNVLDLKAKTEDVTYGRVVLYVDAASFRPHSADFYAFSGRLLKTCSYEGYKELGGAVRPTRLTLRDAVNKDQYSVLEYTEMKVAPLPEKYFSKEYLKKAGQ